MFNKRQATKEKTKSLLEILLLAIICVVALHIFWQLVAYASPADNRFIADLTRRFGLDEELSIPTWLTSMMALLVAGLAWLIGQVQQTTKTKMGWYLIAVTGLFVSIDEVASLHELILQGVHILADFGEQQTFFSNAWLLVLPILLVGLVFVVRYLRASLPKDTFYSLIIAGAVYLTGALVLEYLSIPMDKAHLSYKVGEVVFEETLELLGLWLIIRAMINHIAIHERDLRKKLVGIIS